MTRRQLFSGLAAGAVASAPLRAQAEPLRVMWMLQPGNAIGVFLRSGAGLAEVTCNFQFGEEDGVNWRLVLLDPIRESPLYNGVAWFQFGPSVKAEDVKVLEIVVRLWDIQERGEKLGVEGPFPAREYEL